MTGRLSRMRFSSYLSYQPSFRQKDYKKGTCQQQGSTKNG
ncbi:hypothetical protein SINDD18_00254 [Streptococcus infantis]|uniref:Uncharacterized protein n=1 Tax=Streptococcus infantis TaxID=68892 RepID=A0A139RJ65_9STRE|nr:hypothetical protein SINDD18_00254 [Streptococcus infantis]